MIVYFQQLVTGDHLVLGVLNTAIATEMQVVIVSAAPVLIEHAQQDGEDYHAVKVCFKSSTHECLMTRRVLHDR